MKVKFSLLSFKLHEDSERSPLGACKERNSECVLGGASLVGESTVHERIE